MKCVRVSLVLTELSIGHKRVVQTRTLDESIDESLHVRRIAHESTHTHIHTERQRCDSFDFEKVLKEKKKNVCVTHHQEK